MTEVAEEKPKCSACGRAEDDHPFKHPFALPGEQVTIPEPRKDKKKQEVTPRLVVAPMPDLVLRHALVKKGVITSEELEAAEHELTLGFIPPPGQTDDISAGFSASGGDS